VKYEGVLCTDRVSFNPFPKDTGGKTMLAMCYMLYAICYMLYAICYLLPYYPCFQSASVPSSFDILWTMSDVSYDCPCFIACPLFPSLLYAAPL
jgi:hypothetical protein